MDDSIMVFDGAAVKALSNGKIGGLAVVFSGPGDPDRTREFFDARTDFDLADRRSIRVLYDHNLDPAVQGELTRATFAVRPDGIFATATLNLRDPTQKTLFAAVEQNKLGWSSAAARHTIRYEPMGDVRRIAVWQLVEFSLTRTPAEPRARAVALKSLAATPAASLVNDQRATPQMIAELEADYIGRQVAAIERNVNQILRNVKEGR
jgi:phage head maturation protease